MKLKKLNLTIILLLGFGILSSCLKNEICSPLLAEPQAEFFTLQENAGIIDTIPASINFDSIYGLTLENQNLIKDALGLNTISFPLNPAEIETAFVVCAAGKKDTIRFFYEKQLLFQSVKCGVYYTYTITDIHFSTNLLKGLTLIKPEVDVNSTENIQMFY